MAGVEYPSTNHYTTRKDTSPVEDDLGLFVDEEFIEGGPMPLTPTTEWVTKDGQRVQVCDMSSDHLFNAIRLVRRVAAYNMAVEDWYYYELDAELSDKDWYSPEPAPNEGMDINDWLTAHVASWAAMVAEVNRRGGSWHTALTSPSDADLIVWSTMLVLKAHKASRE